MPHKVYGDPQGRLLFYLHGTPGAVAEGGWLDTAARDHGLRLLVLDRQSIAPELCGDDYLDQLTAEVLQLAGTQPVHLSGFSIGASLVLRIAARLPQPAAGLWLLSAAAPLELPGSLEGMGAGRHTFAMARGWPRSFAWLAAYQGCLARHRPALLVRLLFQGASSADAQLLTDQQLQGQLCRIQQQGFVAGAQAYVRDVRTYVQPWASCLTQVRAPVQLWHGTADNWAPPGMPRNLHQVLGEQAQLHWLQDLAHYSCLLAAAEPLCQGVAASFSDS